VSRDRGAVTVAFLVHPTIRLNGGSGAAPPDRPRSPTSHEGASESDAGPTQVKIEHDTLLQNQYMSHDPIDDYLARVEEPKRSTLEQLRRTILEIVPEAEECISYQVPAFRVDGKVIAGFAAFKNHLSYLPFSGSVLNKLTEELDGYDKTVSALHFPVDRPLPEALVKKLIDVRLRELRRG
jgi:uncharacterized protein YdhG (YjbR/CyaY superfamily)